MKWLNDKGQPHGAPDLGNRALADIEAAEARVDQGARDRRAGQEQAQAEGARRQADATDPDAEFKSGQVPKPVRDKPRTGARPTPPSPLQRDRLRARGLHKLAEELDELPVGAHRGRFTRQLAELSNRELAGLEQIARLESQGVNLSTALDDMMLWKANDLRELLGLLADVGPKSGRDGLESTLHSIFQRTVKTAGTELHAFKGSWGELYAARDAVSLSRATHIEFQVSLSNAKPLRVADIVADTPNGRIFFEVKTNTQTAGSIIEDEVVFDLVHFAGSEYRNLKYLYHPNVTADQRVLLGERMIAFFDDPRVARKLGGSVDKARSAFRAWLDAGGLGAYSLSACAAAPAAGARTLVGYVTISVKCPGTTPRRSDDSAQPSDPLGRPSFRAPEAV